MPKRTSTLQHSKRVETQVARYLFGPEAARDWTERHDISGEDNEGRLWRGEVKDLSPETIRERGGLLKVGEAALRQVEATPGEGRPFAVVHVKRQRLEDACAAVRYCQRQHVIAMPLAHFRASWLMFEEGETDGEE